MKKLLLCLILTGWLVFQSSSAVAAYIYGIEAGDMIKFTKYNKVSGAGEFTWIADTDNDNNFDDYKWQSFCVERKEYVSQNTPYTVAGITGAAENGTDPLDNQTAWLYWKFSSPEGLGTGNYKYDYSNTAHQAYLQNYIWSLEDEIDAAYQKTLKKKAWYDDYLSFTNSWSTDYFSAYNNGDGWVNQGEVQVVNLGYFDNKGKWKGIQDQLIVGTPVPEPGTMVLMGFGLIGLAGIGRKKPKNPIR